MYKWYYTSPPEFSDIIMTSDGEYLTGLWFEGSRFMPDISSYKENPLPVFEKTVKWLDIYFSGNEPDFTPEYRITNLTPFRQAVSDIMCTVPYGEVTTYGSIAKQIAKSRGTAKMSAQAVGSAVGHNPVCIIIPCHRVMGSDGSLTGYGGGINNKIALLKLEGNDVKNFI